MSLVVQELRRVRDSPVHGASLAEGKLIGQPFTAGQVRHQVCFSSPLPFQGRALPHALGTGGEKKDVALDRS